MKQLNNQQLTFGERLALSTCLFCGSPIIPHKDSCEYCGCYYKQSSTIKQEDTIDMTDTGTFQILSFDMYQEGVSTYNVHHHGLEFKVLAHPFNDGGCTIRYTGEHTDLDNTFKNAQRPYIPKDYLFDYKGHKILCKEAWVVSLSTDYNENNICIKRAELLPQQIIVNEQIQFQ
jgi:hypothetical protein